MVIDTSLFGSSATSPDTGRGAGLPGATLGPAFALISCLLYETGQIVFRKLGDGSQLECDRMADAIPALAYNGSVKVVQSDLLTMPMEDWQEIGGGHDLVWADLDKLREAVERASAAPSASRDEGGRDA